MPSECRRLRDSAQDVDQYIILVKDIPRHCRWQELKDMTRFLGGEQSLKAEVFELHDGSQMGHCTIKGRSAANQVYEKFCQQGWNGQRVSVSLAVLDKTGNLRTLEGPQKSHEHIQNMVHLNPPYLCQQIPVVTSPHPCHHVFTAAASTPMPYQPGIPISACLPAPIAPLTVTRKVIPSYYAAEGHAESFSSRPGIAYNTRSMDTPTAKPLKAVDQGSTICVSGLPYYHSETEIRRLLERFGQLAYLEIPPDTRNPSKSKGTARARYQTSTEALSAVRGLDKKLLANRRLNVRQIADLPATSMSKRHQDAQKGVLSSRTKVVQPKAGVSQPKDTGSRNSRKHPSPPPARHRGRPGRLSNDSVSSSGPLVVNGARQQPTRRGSHESHSASDDEKANTSSDESSDAGTDSEVEGQGMRIPNDTEG